MMLEGEVVISIKNNFIQSYKGYQNVIPPDSLPN